MTTNVPADELPDKVKDAISSQMPIESDKEEKSDTYCSHHFGYLAVLPSDVSFPEECLLCSKVVDCFVNLHK